MSYNQKHNEANKDDNRDGEDNNDSWNMGVEGPTEDESVNVSRERQMRNFLATLMLSQGVPMLTGGDEVARSQNGNNNAYCQDNELAWFDWNFDARQQRLREFTSKLIRLRLSHPNLHRRKFFQDRQIRQTGCDVVLKDVAWFNTDGNELPDEAWNTEWNRSICVVFNGQTLQMTDEEGNPIVDSSFLLIVNAAEGGVEFTLPICPSKKRWIRLVTTEDIDDPFATKDTDGKVIVGGRALALFTDKELSVIMTRLRQEV